MRKAVVTVTIGLVVGLSLSGLAYVGAFEGWERRVADTLFIPRPVSGQIVLVTIDDKSIQAIGRWPWDRGVHAKVLAKLSQAKAIGFDVSFPEKSQDQQDQQLSAALKQLGNVTLPITYAAWVSRDSKIVIKEVLQPIEVLANVASMGVVNKLPDPDGVVRLTPITMINEAGDNLHNFSVSVLAKYLVTSEQEIEQKIVTENGFMRINFAGRPKSYQSYSYVDVSEGTVPEAEFAGKIVLIGATALDLHDNQTTPISGGVAMDGVEIHANTLQTILEGKYLRVESFWMQMLAIVGLALVVVGMVGYMRIIIATVLAGVVAGSYVVYAFWSFDQGVIRVLIYPAVAGLVAYIAMVIYKYLTESRQKQFIKKAFSYYLSPDVMREVLKDPKKLALGGERRLITVLFSDIEGFTTISEKMPAETLAIMLNKYLSRMTRIVFTYNGVLDKYIGDAVMAFWGAPKVLEPADQAWLAVQAAIHMQEEIAVVKKDWSELGDINFAVRIGLNTGEMVVGNMGSDVRFDYTLLGDNVNLGSRLEGINKEYGTRTIMSGSTHALVKDKIISRKVDTVAVKGKEVGIEIFELRGLGRPEQDEADFMDMFEEARLKYERGDFRQALGRFADVERLWSNDPVTQVYIDRCKELIKHPPEKWDGVYHAKTK